MSAGWSWVFPALSGIILTAWSGAAVIQSISSRLRRSRTAVRLSLGFGIGAGLLGLFMFGLALLDVPFSATLLLGFQALLIAIPLMWNAWRSSFQRQEESRAPWNALRAVLQPILPGRREASPEEGPAFRMRRIHRVILLLLCASILAIAWVSVREKASFVDARTVWMLKARVFYLDRGFGGLYFEEWTDTAERRTYPPLVPLYGAYMHLLCGGLNDGAVKLAQSAFALSLLLLLYRMIAVKAGALPAALGVLLFTLCGQTVTLAVWGTADLHLAFYVLGSVWALLEFMKAGDRSLLFLAGIFMGFGVFTKEEGAAAAASLVLSFLLLARPWRRLPGGGLLRRSLAILPLLAGIPVLLAVSWGLFCGAMGFEDHLLDRAPLEKLAENPRLLAERTAFVAKSYLREFANPRWLFAWPLFLPVLVIALLKRSGGGMAFLMLFVPLLLLLYGLVYIILARHVEWHVQTSISRIFYHAFPVLYFVTLVQWCGRRKP